MSRFSDAATTLRSHFDDAMSDTITTARTTAAGAFNSTTLVYAAPTASAPYSAKALVRYGNQTDVEFGEEQAHRDMFTVFTPWDTDILRDDRVTVDVCVQDPDLVGDVLVVLAVNQDGLNARKAAVCELAT